MYTNDGTLQTSFSLISRIGNDTPNKDVWSVSTFDNTIEHLYDSFGKLRVSNPFTLLDLKFPGQTSGNYNFISNNQKITKEFSSGFTGAYGDSKLVMTGTISGSTGYYISQSRNYCIYQPGKSLLVLLSSIINPQNIGFTNRIGYYDNEIPTGGPITTPIAVRNGLYFQHNGTSCYVGFKSNSETLVPQSSWNIDKMDGTGTSKINLDFTKCQLFVIDMEWLGVGRIRYGFYAFGQIVYCHQITNVNALTGPYTNNINLPICFTMQGLTGTGSGNMTQICSTVISEGGYNTLGTPFAIASGRVSTTANVETPILAIRPGSSNFKHQGILPSNISIIDDSNTNVDLYKIRLYFDGSSPSTGTTTWTDVDASYSIAQYSEGTNIIRTGSFTTTNSIIINEGYFSGKDNIPISNNLGSIFNILIEQLNSNILNKADILLVTVTATASASNIYASINWNEIY